MLNRCTRRRSDSVAMHKLTIGLTIQCWESEQKRDHRPHLIIALLGRPRGHTSKLNSMFDDVEELLRSPLRKSRWQRRRKWRHSLGDFWHALFWTAMTWPTASLVMTGTFEHGAWVVQGWSF